MDLSWALSADDARKTAERILAHDQAGWLT